MDSIHGDDRNLAHSAAGRNVTNKVDNSTVETAKLKEDHDKQIQKLTFENKIKFLESENNHQIKIMQLEKDNQSLTHELELLKLKTSHEQEAKKVVVDREMEKEMLKQQNEFQIKINEKDKELAGKDKKMAGKDKALAGKDKDMTVRENEFKLKMKDLETAYENKLLEKGNESTSNQKEYTLKLTQKDQEMIAKENEFKLKFAEVEAKLAKKENVFKLKLAEVENANKLKFAEIEDKVNELNLKLIKELEIIQKKQDEAANAMHITTAGKLTWGAGKFFESKPIELNLFASYQDWYKEISSLLHGEKEIVSSGASKYVFVKRDCGGCFEDLHLFAHRKGHKRHSNTSSYLLYIED
eukprot:TCONS_00052988-protein